MEYLTMAGYGTYNIMFISILAFSFSFRWPRQPLVQNTKMYVLGINQRLYGLPRRSSKYIQNGVAQLGSYLPIRSWVLFGKS